MKRLLTIAALSALAISPVAVNAGSLPGHITVNATVVAACSAFTPPATTSIGTNLIIGQTLIHPTTAPNISFTCVTGAPVAILLDAGLNSTGTAPANEVRHLLNGTDTQAYGIFQDSGFTTQWGDNGATIGSGTSALTSTGTGAAKLVPVYIQIPVISGTAVAGTYSDTVSATITF